MNYLVTGAVGFKRPRVRPQCGKPQSSWGACQCALLRALHIADCKRPPDKL